MSYIGQQLPADVFSGFVTDAFTGDGSATTFTLSKAPFSEDGLIVVINNVIQRPTTNFTVSGTTLTIVGTAVASGDVIYAIHTSGAVPSTLASKVDVNGLSDGVVLDADADTTISADTDDQIDFKAGGTDIMSLTATTATINDGLTVSVSDNTDTLTLKSTDADANVGPVINFTRDSSSPADNDFLGAIDFQGDNDAGETHDYVRILSRALDVSDGSEKADLAIKAADGNNYVNFAHTEVIFNEDGQDRDFRVENDNGGNLLNLQANNPAITSGEGCVGINSANSDGNFFELNSGQGNVYTANFINSENDASKTLYGIKIFFNAQNKDDQSSLFLVCQDTGTVRLKITSDGDVLNHDNAFGAISDERVKEQVTDASSQWDDVKAMKIRKYKMKEDVAKGDSDAHWRLGVIAQELEASNMNGLVVDETKYTEDDQDVAINKTANAGDIKSYKSVKYSILYMKAIKALQEAMAKIETLETKVKALEDA